MSREAPQTNIGAMVQALYQYSNGAVLVLLILKVILKVCSHHTGTIHCDLKSLLYRAVQSPQYQYGKKARFPAQDPVLCSSCVESLIKVGLNCDFRNHYGFWWGQEQGAFLFCRKSLFH